MRYFDSEEDWSSLRSIPRSPGQNSESCANKLDSRATTEQLEWIENMPSKRLMSKTNGVPAWEFQWRVARNSAFRTIMGIYIPAYPPRKRLLHKKSTYFPR